MQPLVLITGGSRGLGRATAFHAARRGARVVVTCRTDADGAEVCAQVRASVPGAEISYQLLELGSLRAVHSWVASWSLGPVAALVANAGVRHLDRDLPARTEDGFEPMLGVNVVGHLALSLGMLPWLRAARGRVVMVSSRLHAGALGMGGPASFAVDDLYRASRPPLERYKTSKLANLLVAYEWDRRFAPLGVRADAICPGFVPETVAERQRGWGRFWNGVVLPCLPFARRAAEAASRIADLALLSGPAQEGGRFFSEGRPISSSPLSYDRVLASRLWEELAPRCLPVRVPVLPRLAA